MDGHQDWVTALKAREFKGSDRGNKGVGWSNLYDLSVLDPFTGL